MNRREELIPSTLVTKFPLSIYIDHNKPVDIIWHLGVRHQVAAIPLSFTPIHSTDDNDSRIILLPLSHNHADCALR